MGLQRYRENWGYDEDEGFLGMIGAEDGYWVKADEAEARINELEKQLAKCEESLNEVIEWNKKYPPLSKDL